MATKRKRRKPESERKEDVIKVTCTAEQKRVITEHADALGLDVSSWLRSLALREAKGPDGSGEE